MKEQCINIPYLCLQKPTDEIEVGVSDIEFARVDVTNMTFGTMAQQNANNVNITGGQFNITAATNSGMILGVSAGITFRLGNSSATMMFQK